MKNQNSCRAIHQPRLLSMADVMTLTTYSRASIYRLIATRGFPRPIKMGDVKIAFLADEVEAWLKGRPRALAAYADAPSH